MFLPTETQHRILELLRTGPTNKAIARRLNLSVSAVEYHMTRLFERTGTTNRVELILWWVDYSQVNPFEQTGRRFRLQQGRDTDDRGDPAANAGPDARMG